MIFVGYLARGRYMEKMSKSNERRLLKALEKAAMCSQGEHDPDQVLIKVSSEYSLTPNEILRVVETYNKAKSVSFLKNASADHRASDFPLANATNIIKAVFAESKTAEEYKDFSTRLREYTDIPLPMSVEKVAEEKKRQSATLRDMGSFWKEATEFFDECAGLAEDARRNYAENLHKVETAMRKVSDYCAMCQGKELRKIAGLIVNGYGEQGLKFINDVNNRLPKPLLPKLEKTAHAAMFPTAEPFLSIAEAFHSGRRLSLSIRNQQTIEKLSAMEGLPNPARTYQSIMGSDKAPTEEVSLDPQTGVQDQWSNYLRSIQAKKMLYNLYRFDPIIKSYPLDDVLDVFNEVSEVTPALSGNKAWMRSNLRRMLTQGKALDPFELKDLFNTEKTKVDSNLAYARSVGAMLDQDQKGGGNKTTNYVNIKAPTTVPIVGG